MAFRKEHTEIALSLQEKLCERFPIKKLGEANSFLGIKIIRNRSQRKMWLVQKAYLEKVRKSYTLRPQEKITSPLSPGYDMTPNSGDKLSADLIQAYQRKVGTAIYAAICTRPDISLAVSMCADHLLNPATRHIHAINRVLQYLIDTEYFGILYDSSFTNLNQKDSTALLMASDASFGDNEGRESSQGFIAFLYGGPVV